MPRIALTLLLLTFVGLLAAQEEEMYFHDEFTRYSDDWTQVDSSRARVADGELRLSQADPTGRLFFIREAYLSLRSNFKIETSFRLDPSTPTGQLGIVWSSTRDRSEYYLLLIRPDGYLAIESVLRGEVQFLRDWTRCGKLKKPGKDNVVRLRKHRYTLYVEVNGKDIFQLDFPPMRGLYHGLLLDGRMTAKVDYYRIAHPPLERLLVDDMHVQAERFPLDTPVNQPFRDEIAPIASVQGRHLYFSMADTAQGPYQAQLALSQVIPGRGFGPPRLVTGLPDAAQHLMVGLAYRQGEGWLASHQPGQAAGVTPIRRQVDTAWQVEERLDLPTLPPQRQPIEWFVPEKANYLLFSAELPGGFGHRDLWVIEPKAQGGWGQPRNLGSQVNSFGNERSPYLDEATRQLYFSSDAQPGYGGLDVYRCESLGDQWTYWGPPANLGQGINGPADEWYYRPLKQQPNRAYLSAQDSVGGDFDLYQVRIPIDLTKAGLLRIQGEVFNRNTQQRVGGSTLMIGQITPDSLLPLRADRLDSSSFDLLLPFGQSYQLYAVKPGYYSLSDTLNVRPVSSYQVVQQNLYLRPIEVGSTIGLEKVYFKRASPELLPESYPELRQLWETMHGNPGLKIEIRGHTDNLGEEGVLQALSEARAAQVRRYLLDRGIPPTRVSSRGFGGTQPVASNEDPATRSLNRRVEFRIISL